MASSLEYSGHYPISGTTTLFVGTVGPTGRPRAASCVARLLIEPEITVAWHVEDVSTVQRTPVPIQLSTHAARAVLLFLNIFRALAPPMAF